MNCSASAEATKVKADKYKMGKCSYSPGSVFYWEMKPVHPKIISVFSQTSHFLSSQLKYLNLARIMF